MTYPGRLTKSRRGSALVEFALTAFLLLMLVFGVIEMQRMLLVYTTLANSARAGVRYAIVHGSKHIGGGVDGPSGPGSTTQVETVVKNFASAGLLTIGNLNISVCYTTGSGCSGTNDPSSIVKVTVKYTYDPIVSWFTGFRVTLGSTTQGVITF